MKNLDEIEWIPFTVNYLFSDIQSTNGETTGQLVLGDDIPYIAAAKTNNGCAYMCKNINENWISKGNAMVFVCLGDGAAGLAHYIPMDFIGMNGKTAAGYSQYLNENNGIFIANCLSVNKKLFSHGHSWSGDRLKGSKAMLPATDDNNPDYDYMYEYTQAKRNFMLKKYCAYIEKRLAELGDIVDIPTLNEKKWIPFTVNYLFPNIQSTNGETTGQLVLGDDVPYIAAAKTNNGCAYICKNTNQNWVSKGNAMVFVCLGDGAAGLAHYIPMDFIGMNGKTAVGYSPFLNKYNGIFIANCLSVNKKIFSHGHSWSGDRLKNSKAMLPTTKGNKPDYAYMEQYTKNIMIRKYRQYLNFINRKYKNSTTN